MCGVVIAFIVGVILAGLAVLGGLALCYSIGRQDPESNDYQPYPPEGK